MRSPTLYEALETNLFLNSSKNKDYPANSTFKYIAKESLYKH
jgi:hypothetical protein